MSRITFGTITEPQPPEELVPPAFLDGNPADLLHQWGRERTLVFCQRAAYDAMHAHARCDTHHECTGLMVGQVFHDPEHGRAFVVIEQSVPVDAASSSGVHVHIDVERFNRAYAAIQHQMPGALLVGWYHTHPNLGIFLSGTDHQVTKGLFNASWHVATVIDPVRNEEGSFTMQGDRRLSSLVLVKDPTPVTELMALYRSALDLLDRQAFTEASRTLDRLQTCYQQAVASGSRQDLRHWLQRGEYRDLTQLISRARAGQPYNGGHDSGEGQPSEPGHSQQDDGGAQQLRELLHGQAELDLRVGQLDQRISTATARRPAFRNLPALLLGLVIAAMLGTNIYLHALQLQMLQDQNQLLREIVSGSAALGQEPDTVISSPSATAVGVSRRAPAIAPTRPVPLNQSPKQPQ